MKSKNKWAPRQSLGYVHTYPGLFENGAFRPRIHRDGHTHPHVSGAFWKRLGPKTELFENAPESGSFENGGFGSGSFLRVNIVSGSFLPLFPRRSKWLAHAINIASRACAVSLPKPVAAIFFEGSCLRKQNGGWLLLSSEATLPRRLLRRRSGVFFCFILLRLFVCVSFCLWSLSFITCLHDTYTPSLGHKHVTQYKRTTLTSKGNKQKKCDLSLRRVRLCQHTCRTQRPWFSGGATFPWINPHPCERGLQIDVRYVWTPQLQNGSFRKRIFSKTYTCARSLRMRGRVRENTGTQVVGIFGIYLHYCLCNGNAGAT